MKDMLDNSDDRAKIVQVNGARMKKLTMLLKNEALKD